MPYRTTRRPRSRLTRRARRAYGPARTATSRPRQMPRAGARGLRKSRLFRLSGTRPRRPVSPPWPWRLLAGILAAAVLAGVAVLVVHAHGSGCSAAHDEIIWADQVTNEEGDDPTPPGDLIGRADQFASCGGGELLLIRAAGQGGVEAGRPVSLRIDREPGQLEQDPAARQMAVQHLIGNAFRRARNTPAPGAGRDVIGLLGTITSELGSGQNYVWIRTLGLPTVDPANARVLMAADPAQAVASIARWVPSLRRARVHLILSPPAGSQTRFNTATDAWRRAFMVDLLRQAGADLVSVNEVATVEAPAPGAPTAPVVPNLPDPTPELPKKPQPGKPYVVKLNSSAFFLPDSTAFAASTDSVLTDLQPIIRAWRTGKYSHIEVVGHCAKFGPPAGALLLSRQRAARVAALLRIHGVTTVTSEGVGYDQLLTPDPQNAANRVVIVTAYPRN